MSGLRFTVAPGEIALTGGAAKTVLQVKAPAEQRVKLWAFGLYFDGTSATAEPVVAQLVRQTTDGTLTSVTPSKLDPGCAETIQTAAGKNASSEPTAGDVLKQWEVHPQRSYEWTAPLGREILVPGGERLALVCTAPASVNVIPWMELEE